MTSQLAPGWTAILDETHQRYYYYDTKTGKSQWEMPTAAVQIPPPPPSVTKPQPTTKQVPPTSSGFSDELDASFPDLDDTLAATEEMLTKLNMTDNNNSSSSGSSGGGAAGNFDFNNPRYEQRDSEDEEEEPYVLEEGVLDSGYDSDGNPINYDNMEINFGDVYDDDDDGWIAAVNPTKGRQEMGSNPIAAKNGTIPAAKVPPPPPATSSSGGVQNKGGKAAASAAEKTTKPRTKYINAQAPSSGPPYPNVQVAYDKGFNHDHVQCLITRDRSGITAKMYPTYELRLESTDTPMLLAKKMNLNRTSNYHLFDLTRGGSTSNKSMFTKNSGNFIGKLRARDMQRTEYVLLNAAATEREEIAGFMFDRVDVMTSITEGSQPRKLLIVIPPLDARGIPIPNRVAIGDEEIGSIINVLRYPGRTTGLHLLQTKEPTYINGNYRLNFRGRVKIPSVKNFQIVSAENVDNILVQFGKIGDDRFHLDFKAPFNAMQAFALALSQFNL